MSYRDRFLSQISDPRMKLSWQVIAFGGPFSLASGLLVLLPGFLIFAMATQQGSFSEKLARAFIASRSACLVLLAATVFNCVFSVVAFRQLKRMAPQAKGVSTPTARD